MTSGFAPDFLSLQSSATAGNLGWHGHPNGLSHSIFLLNFPVSCCSVSGSLCAIAWRCCLAVIVVFFSSAKPRRAIHNSSAWDYTQRHAAARKDNFHHEASPSGCQRPGQRHRGRRVRWQWQRWCCSARGTWRHSRDAAAMPAIEGRAAEWEAAPACRVGAQQSVQRARRLAVEQRSARWEERGATRWSAQPHRRGSVADVAASLAASLLARYGGSFGTDRGARVVHAATDHDDRGTQGQPALGVCTAARGPQEQRRGCSAAGRRPAGGKGGPARATPQRRPRG
mgnify:CR=1 FL=1